MDSYLGYVDTWSATLADASSHVHLTKRPTEKLGPTSSPSISHDIHTPTNPSQLKYWILLYQASRALALVNTAPENAVPTLVSTALVCVAPSEAALHECGETSVYMCLPGPNDLGRRPARTMLRLAKLEKRDRAGIMT
jgi:hypothetical protein